MTPPQISINNGEDNTPTNTLAMFSTYRLYEEHENNLLNHRTTWLVTINSVIIATFGFSCQKLLEVIERIAEFDNGEAHTKHRIKEYLEGSLDDYRKFLVALAIIGLIVSLWSTLSISAAVRAQVVLRRKWKRFSSRPDAVWLPDLSGGGSKYASRLGGWMALGLPIFLSILWIIIIIVFANLQFSMHFGFGL